MKNRVLYFDGLKGISALIVFLSHFIGTFTCISWIAKIPILNIFLDGTMAVHVFIMLSGFGICTSMSQSGDIATTVGRIVLKRYFRLALPIVIPTIIAYILYEIGAYHNQEVASSTNNQWLSALMPS
ncbi:MAG: acyltransferase family protein [Lachnospiraceae bacterium]|nr:acyltransferase family protein [Lachnospiraceae bacterium]